MNEHKIKVTETSSRIITVDAESENDAIEVAQTMYTSEKIVLDASDYDDVEFEVTW